MILNSALGKGSTQRTVSMGRLSKIRLVHERMVSSKKTEDHWVFQPQEGINLNFSQYQYGEHAGSHNMEKELMEHKKLV